MVKPFIPVEWTAVVDFNQFHDGSPFCNSFYWYHYLGPWTEEDLTTLANAMNEWYIGTYLYTQGQDLEYRGCKVRDLTTVDGLTVELPVTGYFGAQPYNCLPVNACIYIRTAPTRKAGDPYYFWVHSGIPEVFVTGNTVDLTYLNLIFERFITLQDVEPGIGIDPVHVKYIRNGVYLSAGEIHGFGATDRPKQQIGTRARRARNKIFL